VLHNNRVGVNPLESGWSAEGNLLTSAIEYHLNHSDSATVCIGADHVFIL
jgi:hypothetical protein